MTLFAFSLTFLGYLLVDTQGQKAMLADPTTCGDAIFEIVSMGFVIALPSTNRTAIFLDYFLVLLHNFLLWGMCWRKVSHEPGHTERLNKRLF